MVSGIFVPTNWTLCIQSRVLTQNLYYCNRTINKFSQGTPPWTQNSRAFIIVYSLCSSKSRPESVLKRGRRGHALYPHLPLALLFSVLMAEEGRKRKGQEPPASLHWLFRLPGLARAGSHGLRAPSVCYRSSCVPPEMYIEVLTCVTSECDPNWK